MNKIIILGMLTFSFLLAGCGSDDATIALPAFITATLPSTETPPPASTPIPPTATEEVIVAQPVEGVTTTQLNIRSEPSTAGESVGTAAAFSTVQIAAKESYGKWFQILDSTSSNGKGWIIANYVQVDNPGEIPIIDLGATSLIVQGVNVRTGPGKEYDSLGTLVPNDVVLLTGKDPSGDWLQINFKGSPGWISSEFIQVQNIELLPVISNQNQASAETEAPVSDPLPPVAMQDNDSLESPTVSIKLSSAGVSGLQSSGFISPASGDEADWIQFTAVDTTVSTELKCSGNELKLDLYQNGALQIEGFLACNEVKTINTSSGQIYTLKLSAIAETQNMTPYSTFVHIVR